MKHVKNVSFKYNQILSIGPFSMPDLASGSNSLVKEIGTLLLFEFIYMGEGGI